MTTTEMSPQTTAPPEVVTDDPANSERVNFVRAALTRVIHGVEWVAVTSTGLPSGGYASNHGEQHGGVNHFPTITDQDTAHWLGF